VRVAFLGNDPWSVPSLLSVARSEHELALVATRAPRPAGRGRRPRPTAVAVGAGEADLPVLEVDTVKAGPGLDALRAALPDVLVVVAYGEILPGEILALPRVAPVNVHFSLLPALRGANPVARAIDQGFTATGVTTMRMDEGLDTGPILLQQEVAIETEDDSGTLGDRLARAGGDLLVRTLDGLEGGEIEERPQDDSLATAAPRFAPQEEWIDWTGAAEAVWRRIRALAPDPGARTRFRGRTLKVLAAEPTSGRGEPGAILATDGPVVATGTGALLFREVVPEGRRRMPGADWARGARPRVGEVLGSSEADGSTDSPR
jgi:methionyl-tRNA formyltransferase